MNGGLRPPAFSPHRRRFLTAAAAAAGGLALGAPRLFADAGEGLVLRAAPATASLADGYDIPVWAFNGRVPGPEIRVRQGEWVRVRFENGLEQESTIHWHGIRLNNAMDGVPDLTQAPVAAGDGFDAGA